MLPLGDGPGLTPLPGDSLPSTTAAGFHSAATGAGLLDLITCGLITHRLWWLGSEARALGLDSDLVLVADLAGARWVGVSHSFRGTVRAAVISATSTSATRTSPISRTSPTTIT